MKTMLKSLAAIRTWLVALAVTFLSGAMLASEIYSNSFASNDATVTPGTYGEIVVPGNGFEATKFTSEFDKNATISGGRGSFANVISGGAVHTHTVSGWFKTDSLDRMVYAALADVTKWGAGQNGYKVYCTSEGKLQIGKVNSDTCEWDAGSATPTGPITVPTELKANAWYYLTIAITVNSSKVATAVVFVNGTKVYDEATTFKLNLNGNTCQRFWIGAGISAAGLYIDSTQVTDADTVKGWATNHELVEAAITRKEMPSNYTRPNMLFATLGAYADSGVRPKDGISLTTIFEVNGSDEYWSGALDESGAFPFTSNQEGAASLADERGILHFKRGRIYEGQTLVRYFVPCRTDAGEVGFWDFVEGKFYGNGGTGRFWSSYDGGLRLSYIQSSGSQYIDTGVYDANAMKTTGGGFEAVADLSYSDTSEHNVLASRKDASNRYYLLSANSGKFRNSYGGHYTYDGYTLNKKYHVESVLHNGEQRLKVMDGATLLFDKVGGTSAAQIDMGKNLYLFAVNDNGSPNWYARARLYSCKITKDNFATVLRDFLPARSADGRIGVIDLANGGVFYPNKASVNFTWGGIAYTLDGTTLKLHEGTLAAEDLADYTAVEKVDVRYELNAGAVTEYAIPLTLSEGVFALTDGEVNTVSVNGKLAINGGVTLKIDAVGEACDNFVAQSLDLTDATADNPIVIEIVSAHGMDWSAGATLIENTGLADGACANIRIANNDDLMPVIKDGNLMIQMKSAAAHWIGAVDNDPTKPGNWEEGAVPTAETIVYFASGSVPNIAIGTPFTAKSVELNVTLAGDYDWRGLNPNIPLTGKIDLNGHELAVSYLTGEYEITDTTDTSADDATPGELHVDVAAGETIENTTVTLSGMLKFVKDGAGTFSVTKTETYAGGTDVKGGTLRCDGKDIYPGKLSTPVTVYEGAVYDIGNIITEWQTQVVLAGGTLTNKLKDHSYGGKPDYYGQNPVIKVVDDSTISVDYTFGMVAGGYKPTTLDLGGNKLEVSIANGMIFVLDNTEVSAGLLKVTGVGTLMFKETSLRAAEADFDLECGTVSVQVPAEVKDLTVRSGTVVSGNGVITVNGVYRPLGATAPKVLLKNGASFDLSTFEAAFDLAGTTTTFEDDATIQINVGERKLETNEKVIAWTQKPANVGKLTFKFVGSKLDGETVNAVVADDGIYYPDVTTIVKATWTGAAGDGKVANPANWSCENALGGKVTGDDALPGASTVVQLDGEIAFNVPSGASFTAGSVNANASLKDDCDWSGLGSSIPISGIIDLKGHKLMVANLVGNYEITDSSATVYEQLEYIQSNGSQWIDTGVLGNMGLEAELDILFSSKPGTTMPIAAYGSGSNDRFYMFYTYSGKLGYRLYNQSYNMPFTVETNTRYQLKSILHNDELSFEVDGVETQHATTGITPVNTGINLYMFACNERGKANYGASIRVFSGKISEGGTVLRDFVPVKRSDGAIGLLDLAHLGTENEFYVNKGSGTFTAGATTGCILTKLGCSEEAMPGEFHVNVASGSIKNTGITFTGSTKIVKDGEGTLELGTIKQSNAGGWEIAEGTVKASGDLHTYTSFGQERTTVTVREGATYDQNGQYDSRYYSFVLDGGTIANRGGNLAFNGGSMGPITLTKDSYLNAASPFPLWGKVDLGGFKLTVDVGVGKSLYLYKDESNVGGIFENGTVDIRTGGWIQFDAVPGNLRDMRTVDFTLNAALNLITSVNVRDLTVVYDQNYKSGSGTANIYGVFTPSAKNYIHNFVMQDGATLNLAGKDGIYDFVSSVVTGESNTLRFADGATINIVPGNKRVGKIVSWTDETKPAEGVTFVMEKKYGKLQIKDDGLYLHHGSMIILR